MGVETRQSRAAGRALRVCSLQARRPRAEGNQPKKQKGQSQSPQRQQGAKEGTTLCCIWKTSLLT